MYNKSPYIKPKGFCPNPIAKFGIPKNADTRLNPRCKGTLDWQRFWEEQLYYIHNGYITGGMWIPGRYYYYLNFSVFNTVKGPIFPQVVDVHLELAYLIDHCKANGRNMIAPKGRRVGISEAGHKMIVDYGWRFFEGYNAGVAAGLDIYVQDFMKKWEDANAMIAPEFKIKTLINNDDEVIAGYKFKDVDGNNIEEGTKNTIYRRTMHNNPNLFKGLYLNDAVAEEMGEFDHAEEFYTATKDCLMFGEKQVGCMWMYGTGGNMATSSKAFQNIWHNSESYNAERFFIPRSLFYFPYYGGATEDSILVEKVPNLQHMEPHQRIGVVDIKAAEEAIIEYRKSILATGDLKKYHEECQNTAINIKEVFTKSVSNNFNFEKLNSQGYEIESHVSKKYGKYKMSWKVTKEGEVVFPREVIATPATIHDKDEECVYILFDGHPTKGYRGLFCAGIDSYDQDESRTSKSLGAMVVLRKINANPALLNKQAVCVIRTRPPRKEMFYDMCAKVAVYYGLYANSLIDVGKPGIIKHFEDLGLRSYLAYRPRKFESTNSTQTHEFGVSLNSYSKPLMVSLLQSYILDYVDTVWFPDIIDEALIYDEYEKDSDNDTIDALGIALMQMVSDGSNPMNMEDKELEKAFEYPSYETDADGHIVASSDKSSHKDVFEDGINITRSMLAERNADDYE